VRTLWDKIIKFIETIFETKFPVSDTEKYFGIQNPLNSNLINIFNYIFLNVRSFIWNDKRLGKPCSVIDFLLYLRGQVQLEMATKLHKTKDFILELYEHL
jgi:hypothetical protein